MAYLTRIALEDVVSLIDEIIELIAYPDIYGITDTNMVTL